MRAVLLAVAVVVGFVVIQKYCYRGNVTSHLSSLLSLTVKADDVTSDTRNVDPHGRLRAVQGRMSCHRLLPFIGYTAPSKCKHSHSYVTACFLT